MCPSVGWWPSRCCTPLCSPTRSPTPGFQAEARVMAALTHPNVINVYEYGQARPAGDGTAYLVMAYVDGKPLSQRIAEAGRLSVPETISVLVQAANALHAVHHAGIIHCDVKPANLLVATDGTVILVDSGAARPAAASVANAVLGTPLYMAPEQATDQQVTPATDVYALGAVAYHCLTGRPPFTGKTPMQIALRHVSDKPTRLPSDIPEALRRLIARAMDKDPTRRYPTAADFATAVHRARAVSPPPPRVSAVVCRAGGLGGWASARPYRSAVALPDREETQPWNSRSPREADPAAMACEHPRPCSAPGRGDHAIELARTSRAAAIGCAVETQPKPAVCTRGTMARLGVSARRRSAGRWRFTRAVSGDRDPGRPRTPGTAPRRR
jgi:serine/threonine protein kinase